MLLSKVERCRFGERNCGSGALQQSGDAYCGETTPTTGRLRKYPLGKSGPQFRKTDHSAVRLSALGHSIVFWTLLHRNAGLAGALQQGEPPDCRKLRRQRPGANVDAEPRLG